MQEAPNTDSMAIIVAQQNMDNDISNNKESNRKDNEVSYDDRELFIEQQFWEHTDKKLSSSKPKYAGCQRITQRQMDLIAHQKTIVRSPTYYQFDKSTTQILKRLRDINIVGDYHNIVGYGKNSVVIHAHCSTSTHIFHPMGVAVKVYKLTNDLKHNNKVFKRVQREHDHLLMLQNQNIAWYVPYLVHKCKNVIVTDFIGDNQETAPSIATVPAECAEKLYNILVHELFKLYNHMNLVHGRLSTKNVLYIHSRVSPDYIGWAHSVKREHPMALVKLMEDCSFITQFFREMGVAVMSKEKLFKDVTGLVNVDFKALRASSGRDLWQKYPSNPNIGESPNYKSGNRRFKDN